MVSDEPVSEDERREKGRKQNIKWCIKWCTSSRRVEGAVEGQAGLLELLLAQLPVVVGVGVGECTLRTSATDIIIPHHSS